MVAIEMSRLGLFSYFIYRHHQLLQKTGHQTPSHEIALRWYLNDQMRLFTIQL
jgi:hypothetical protein